jgi:hypothetical protein
MINLNGRLTATERAAKEMRIKAYLGDLVERVAALVPVMLVPVIASESEAIHGPRRRIGLLRRFAPRDDEVDSDERENGAEIRAVLDSIVAWSQPDQPLRISGEYSGASIQRTPNFTSCEVMSRNSTGL